MKVEDLIYLLNRYCDENEHIETYDCVWLNLNIQENITIEEIDVDDQTKTVLFR